MHQIIILILLSIFACSCGSSETDISYRQSSLFSQAYHDSYFMPGQGLRAPHCFFKLDMQADGNLVIYDRAGGNGGLWPRAIWSADTYKKGGYALMQRDGNFVVYNWADQPVWSSNTWGNPFSSLYMQDDGNLVIYDQANRPRWSSNTWAGANYWSRSCGSPSSAITVDYDQDRPGGDYTRLRLGQPKLSWCVYYCSQDSRCTSFAYEPPAWSGASAYCWLKDRTPSMGYRPGYVSGVVLR